MAGGLGQNPGEHVTGVPVARFHGYREMPFEVRNQLPPPGGYELLFDFCKVVEVAVRIRESGRQLIKAPGEIIRCPLVFQTVPLGILQTAPNLSLRVSLLRSRNGLSNRPLTTAFVAASALSRSDPLNIRRSRPLLVRPLLARPPAVRPPPPDPGTRTPPSGPRPPAEP